MALPENPITRKETYLAKIAGQEVQIPEVPITREEAYLNQIAKEGTGTKVIANPDDVAEDVLHKVEIDGEIYSVPSGGGGGGSNDYLDLDNLPQVNGVELRGNKSTNDLGIKFDDLPDKPNLGTASAKNVPVSGDASSSQVVMGNDSRLTDSRPASDVSSWAKQATKPTYTASDVGLGNVPNVSTNDQEPTFTEAGTRNNIASGEKLSVIFGKVQKFFNDLKTVAFSGSFSDLSNKPENANTFQGTIAEWNQLTTAEKKAYDHASIPDSLDGNVTFPASKVMMLSGDSVEDRVDAHTFGTAVDISAYTSSSKYTCPSDGYIFLDATAISVTNGTISVAIDAGSNPILWGAARKSYIETNIICARKGMQIYIGHVDTGGKAYFYPLQ